MVVLTNRSGFVDQVAIFMTRMAVILLRGPMMLRIFLVLTLVVIPTLIGCGVARKSSAKIQTGILRSNGRVPNEVCRRAIARLPVNYITTIRFRFVGHYLYPKTRMDVADQVIVIRSRSKIQQIWNAFRNCDRKAGATEENQLGMFGEVTNRVDFETKTDQHGCSFCVMDNEVYDLYGREVGDLYWMYRKKALYRKIRIR